MYHTSVIATWFSNRFFQLRFFILAIIQRYQRYKIYKSIAAKMESQFTSVTAEELKEHGKVNC